MRHISEAIREVVGKRCVRCGGVYPTAMFNRDRTKRDGFYPRCRGCRSGWGSVLRVIPRRTCGGCGRAFTPRQNKGRFVRNCSRACATKAGVWHRTGEPGTYGAIHFRLKRQPDPGICESCGARGVKLHWALDHERCSAPIKAPQGPYSLDLADYRRLCVPCHKSLDLARLETA